MPFGVAENAEPREVLSHVIPTLSTADLVMQLRTGPALTVLARLTIQLYVQPRHQFGVTDALGGTWIREVCHSRCRNPPQKAQKRA